MTITAREARDRAGKALTALRRTEILCYRYHRASRQDVDDRKAEYTAALDDLAAVVRNSEEAAS